MSILENFLKSVEFPKLLETLASHCQTPAGRDYLMIFLPSTDSAVIENRLSKSQGLEKLLAQQKAPAIPDSQYFIESFERARNQGEILSAKELASLATFLGDVVPLRQYLSTDKEIPAVFQEWLGRLHALPLLKESLHSKVSDKG